MHDLSTYSSQSEPVSEPQFEAEWTLRTAQPVVPLAEVENQAKQRQWIFLVLALLCAALMGALSASLFYSKQSTGSLANSKSQAAAASPINNSRTYAIQNDTEASHSDDELELNDDDQVVTDGTELSDGQNPEETNTTVRKSTKIVKSSKRLNAAQNSQASMSVKTEPDEGVVTKPTSELLPDTDPQTREERRPRRVKREAQRDQARDDQPRDDLFRIRDIFEGPRRRRF